MIFYFSLLLQSKRKVYLILLNKLLTVISREKVPEVIELYFSPDLMAGKILCMYVCVFVRVYVCMRVYTLEIAISIRFGIQEGQAKSNGLYSSPSGHHPKKYIRITF